ncbi:hypothetical protein [Christensenella hongkongensis]|uniref:hypothetical protein n=1 Tax=Christensenella hongkongensis TaxID=270498 RepID=UPI0026710BDD|nr:hypothetical protein [Christensenella hongkongensis]
MEQMNGNQQPGEGNNNQQQQQQPPVQEQQYAQQPPPPQGQQYAGQQPMQGQPYMQQQPPIEQHIHYHTAPPAATRSTGCAAAGFVSALIGLILCWVPFFGAILLLLGLIFSIVGIALSKSRGEGRGLAIAGLVLSLIPLLLVITGVVGILGCSGML